MFYGRQITIAGGVAVAPVKSIFAVGMSAFGV